MVIADVFESVILQFRISVHPHSCLCPEIDGTIENVRYLMISSHEVKIMLVKCRLGLCQIYAANL